MFRRSIVAFVLAGVLVAGLSMVAVSATAVHANYTGVTKPEAGVSVYFDDTRTLTSAAAITQSKLVFTYLKSLGANAVSLDFPFYEVGQTSTNGQQSASAVTSGKGTPSPAVLASVVRMAEGDGLVVQLRPLLSEVGDDQAAGVFRGTITPANPQAWINSYSNWLKPYLYVAQETGVQSFSIGAELTLIVTGWAQKLNSHGAHKLAIHDYLPYWYSLVQTAKSIYSGEIIYSGSHAAPATLPGTGFGFDAYAAVTVKGAQPTKTTAASKVVADFVPGILTNDKLFETVPYNQERLEEVGIPAAVGAWKEPWLFSYPKSTAIARWVQSDWITASCDAFNDLKMQGFYLWALNINTFSSNYDADTAKNINNWQGTSVIASIKSCFASIVAR